MAGERENNLFEGLDFSDIISELGPGLEPEPIIKEETLEEISVYTPQEEEIPKEDAETDLSEEDSTETTEETVEEEIEESNSSPLTPYAKLLVDEGILPNFNLKVFDGTAEGLKEAMVKEIEVGVEDYKESLPEEIKKLLTNYEQGVPLKALLEIDERRFQYNAIKDDDLKDNKDLQKALIRDYYTQTTKFSEDKINKLIQRSEDLEELEEEAKANLPELIKFQDILEQQEVLKARKEEETREKQRQETLTTFKTTLEKTNEIIPGIKVNKNIKDNIYKIMTTPVGEDQYGNPINKIGQYKVEHPYEFDIMLSYLYEATKGFKDWTVLSSAGKTKAIESFEEKIAKQNQRGSGKLPKTPQNQSSQSIFDQIANMKF